MPMLQVNLTTKGDERLLMAFADAGLPADSDDEAPILRSSLGPVLVSSSHDAEVPLLHLSLSRLTPPLPLLLFALNLPCRLAAVANALSGMTNTDLLPLLCLQV
jgi:hypothetical protein